jgi:Tfp pilus assembly protein PilF
LQESGADQEAIAQLRETLRLDPGHERAHYVLGRLYQKMGQAEQARIELEKHKQIKERDRNAQYRRLLITMRDGG